MLRHGVLLAEPKLALRIRAVARHLVDHGQIPGFACSCPDDLRHDNGALGAVVDRNAEHSELGFRIGAAVDDEAVSAGDLSE